MQQVRLRGDKGNEPNVSLLGASGGRGEPERLPQDHAAAQVRIEKQESLCIFVLLLTPNEFPGACSGGVQPD